VSQKCARNIAAAAVGRERDMRKRLPIDREDVFLDRQQEVAHRRSGMELIVAKPASRLLEDPRDLRQDDDVLLLGLAQLVGETERSLLGRKEGHVDLDRAAWEEARIVDEPVPDLESQPVIAERIEVFEQRRAQILPWDMLEVDEKGRRLRDVQIHRESD